MALGLQTEAGGGENFLPVVKYDARAGRVFRIDRHQDSAGNWSSDDVDITSTFQGAFDLGAIEVGWVYFVAGQGPSWALVPLGQPLPARPSETHKQCFRLKVKLGKACGGDVREFASQAKSVIGAVDKLHDAYTAGLKANPGKVPVVAMTGTTAIKSTGKGQTSTNYAPIFEIKSWVDRPADFDAAPAATPEPEPVAATVAGDDDTEF
jgi:hypothetical protein